MRMATDQASRLRLLAQQPTRPASGSKWVMVLSSRSGCGVTTVTTHLALRLHRYGLRVAVVDAAWDDPADRSKNLTQRWHLDERPGLTQWLAGNQPLAELLIEVSDGLYVLPKGTAGTEVDVAHLKNLVIAWQQENVSVDAVFVDGGVGNPQWQTPLWQAVDERLVITLPDQPVLLGTYALLKRMAGVAPTTIRLTVNRATNAQEVQAIFAAFVQVCSQFLGRHVGCDGWLPEDTGVSTHEANFTLTTGPFHRAMECLAVQWLHRLHLNRIQQERLCYTA